MNTDKIRMCAVAILAVALCGGCSVYRSITGGGDGKLQSQKIPPQPLSEEVSPYGEPGLLIAPRKPAFGELPKYELITLENGLRVLLWPDDQLPVTCCMTMTKLDIDKCSGEGAALLVRAIQAGGSKNSNGAAIEKYMREHTLSQTGTMMTADGDMLMQRAFTLQEHAQTSLTMMADNLQNPVLEDTTIIAARDALAKELEPLSKDPVRTIRTLLRHDVNGRSSQFWHRGSPNLMSSMEPERVRGFAMLSLQPQATIVGVYGRFDRDALLQHIKALFSSKPWCVNLTGDCAHDGNHPGRRRIYPTGFKDRDHSAIRLFNIPGATTATLLWGTIGPQRGTDDYPMAQMAQFLLNGSTQEESHYRAYAPRADKRFGEQHVESRLLEDGIETLHCLETTVTPENVAATITQWRAALEKLGKDPVTNSEWDRARFTVIRDERTMGGLYAVSFKLLEKSMEHVLRGLDRNVPLRVQERAWNSNPEQVRDYCARALQPAQGVWIIAGKIDGIREALPPGTKINE